jgi:hypothetical protein
MTTASKTKKVKITHGIVSEHEDKRAKRRMEIMRGGKTPWFLEMTTDWKDSEEPVITKMMLSETGLDMLLDLLLKARLQIKSFPVEKSIGVVEK